MRRAGYLLAILLLCAAGLRAQEDTSRAVRPGAVVAPPLGLEDSLGITVKKGVHDPQSPPDDSLRITLKEGIAVEVEDTIPTKSTLGAVLRSAVIPGWGQFYNESYLKVPVVVGLTGFLVWGVLTEHGNFKDYDRLYLATITEDDPDGDLFYKRYREFYRDRRDTYGWWLLVTYLLQLADAYVDAALFSFDVSDESGIMLIPRPGGLGMQLRF